MILRSRRLVTESKIAEKIVETVQSLFAEFTKVPGLKRFVGYMNRQGEIEILSVFKDEETAEEGAGLFDEIFGYLETQGLSVETSFENPETISSLKPGQTISEPRTLQYLAGWRTKILGDEGSVDMLGMTINDNAQIMEQIPGFQDLVISRPDPYSASVLFVAKKNSQIRKFEDILNRLLSNINKNGKRLELSPSETYFVTISNYYMI